MKKSKYLALSDVRTSSSAVILVPHRPSSVFFDLSRFLEFADADRLGTDKVSGAGWREPRYLGRTSLCGRVGRTNDRTTRSSAPLHADRRAERALPLPAGGRKKCARLENLRATQLLRANTLRRKRVPGTLTVML